MDIFEYKQMSFIVTKEDHFLSIDLPNRFDYLSDFIQCNLFDIDKLKELVKLIEDLDHSEVFIERDEILDVIERNNIDLRINLGS